eukprot:Protomagalhaensia_wolfi_Nauph_80__1626@NODE_2002_length_1248_cov_125_545079_g1567_i0_p1_GENE_NODE_2002_length_1248_cov_125_545079_g1567_i0NODE_2002_length_1248_cov_125_545079_g1567_i0_p1_ORF_typecomplete_len358_score80_22Integrin_beta/PF00362_18/8_7e27VWA/PF00092_28/0_0007VWA/PF00092_28/6_6e03VWA_2/PF13519_6/0_1_NODE_2002_length_1248_cov_125_545079_g1567_i01121185
MVAWNWFNLLFFLVQAKDFESIISYSATKGVSLSDIYGVVEEPSAMRPFHKRPMPRSGQYARYFGEYLTYRTATKCDFPVELVIVQDITYSFDDDIENMVNVQLDLMIDAMAKTHPGSAYAVVPFGDKPLDPFGGRYDFCVRFGNHLSLNTTLIKDDYSQLTIQSGGDIPESQFTAIVAAAQSDQSGWGLIEEATRIIVVVTDAPPHFEGDSYNVMQLPAFSGRFNDEEHEKQCRQEYYPSPDQVRKALLARQAYFGALVYDGSYDYGIPIKSWQWFNSYLNQTDGFVHDLESDASNFWDRLALIITEVEEVECGTATTTEAPPVQPTETVLPTICPPPVECPPVQCEPCTCPALGD